MYFYVSFSLVQKSCFNAKGLCMKFFLQSVQFFIPTLEMYCNVHSYTVAFIFLLNAKGFTSVLPDIVPRQNFPKQLFLGCSNFSLGKYIKVTKISPSFWQIIQSGHSCIKFNPLVKVAKILQTN